MTLRRREMIYLYYRIMPQAHQDMTPASFEFYMYFFGPAYESLQVYDFDI